MMPSLVSLMRKVHVSCFTWSSLLEDLVSGGLVSLILHACACAYVTGEKTSTVNEQYITESMYVACARLCLCH